MTYMEEESEQFYYFTDEEKTLIESFLTSKGYKWNTNTVCGNCCGMYADEYWVNGIGGEWKEEDKEELRKIFKEKGIEASINDRYTISADPERDF